jgi:hypothetical protein
MNIHFSRRIQTKLKEEINPGKTLVYFASGSGVNPEYQHLEYENIILVDNSFRSRFKGKLVQRQGRVLCLAMDCIVAVDIFKKINLKIDCFVVINEGLYEGGGSYALNSDSFLGYVFPILADTFLHIGYRDYYAGYQYYHTKEHWLDIPYDRKEILQEDDEAYLSPALFTNDERYASNAKVTRLTSKSHKHHVFQKGHIEFKVSHSSIWDAIDSLDAAFVRFENSVQKNTITKVNNQNQWQESKLFPIYVYNYNHQEQYTTYNFEAIIAMCQSNKWKHIGLVPNQGQYLDFVKAISSGGHKYPEKITFHHLNAGDYPELYAIESNEKDITSLYEMSAKINKM